MIFLWGIISSKISVSTCVKSSISNANTALNSSVNSASTMYSSKSLVTKRTASEPVLK